MTTAPGDSDGAAPLCAVAPAFRTVLRIGAAIRAGVLLVLAIVLEAVTPLPQGVWLLGWVLVAIWWVGLRPGRLYRNLGYALAPDRLRIVSGLLFRSDTVVPLGRVQHIDVNQGPLMRSFDLATLTVHTAGLHGASVHLPGLQQADALAMRETIRAHIGRSAG